MNRFAVTQADVYFLCFVVLAAAEKGLAWLVAALWVAQMVREHRAWKAAKR